MPTRLNITLAGCEMVATAERALWWPERKTLLVADLHAGKAGHFRRYGLPLPGRLLATDLDRLDSLIREFEPQRMLFLGDLFHSETNDEWAELVTWRRTWPEVMFVLIRGNHDRFMSDEVLRAGGFLVVAEYLDEEPFRFAHAPRTDEESSELFHLAGHLHPAVRIYGRAHTSMRRPCFWFRERSGVLPAFGLFTGSLTIKPAPGDRVLVVGDKQILPWRI
jgi:DNA ligase-associated metallophosphoesterase